MDTVAKTKFILHLLFITSAILNFGGYLAGIIFGK